MAKTYLKILQNYTEKNGRTIPSRLMHTLEIQTAICCQRKAQAWGSRPSKQKGASEPTSMICSAFCSRSRAARVLITPKQTYRGRTDRLINGWMAHLFVHPRLSILLSLLTGLFFKLYLFCSTVYTRSTWGIQAVGTTVIFHIRVNEDLAIAERPSIPVAKKLTENEPRLKSQSSEKCKKQCCELV